MNALLLVTGPAILTYFSKDWELSLPLQLEPILNNSALPRTPCLGGKRTLAILCTDGSYADIMDFNFE